MHGRAHLYVVTAALAHALVARPALAQPRPSDTVRLVVTRDARSPSCPDEARVRALLAARLDRDAIAPDAHRLAALSFSRAPSRFEALLRITGPRARVTSRRLRSSAADCARLGDAAVLVLALAIDPLRALRRPAAAVTPATPVTAPPVTPVTPVTPPPVTPVTPPPVTPVTPVAPPVAPPPVVAAPAPRASTAWQLGALATMGYGVAPGLFAEVLRPGLSLRAAMIRGRVMVPVTLDLDAPADVDDPRGVGAAWALPVSVGVGVCPRFGARVVTYVCATLAAGVVVAWGSGYANDRSDVALAASAGARAGVEVPLTARWRLVASVDVRAMLVRPALAVGSAADTLWEAPPVAAALAVGVAWQNL
jgi:hypothetical protein